MALQETIKQAIQQCNEAIGNGLRLLEEPQNQDPDSQMQLKKEIKNLSKVLSHLTAALQCLP